MNTDLIDELNNKRASIAVIGLGYVGLPVATTFAKHYNVIAFDLDEKRVSSLKSGEDKNNELDINVLNYSQLYFTSDINDIKGSSAYIVTVPTPVDKHHIPDLSALKSACTAFKGILTKGNWVIFESTVYPGCTEEVCIPILENVSGLKWKEDFIVGYSPERINPGDKNNTIETISKIVAGHDRENSKFLFELYSKVIKAPIFTTSSIKVAEAAKIVENTQRDINIALMNELSLIFKKMDINTYEVLEAAATKWNFLNFQPGLVGGHCISVDPYYLTYKATQLGYFPRVISSGRNVNNAITAEITKEIVQLFIQKEKNLAHSRVLIMGITFKENVSDFRDSRVIQLVRELKEYRLQVDVMDPYANSEEILSSFGFGLISNVKVKYDAIILAVGHKEYLGFDEAYFLDIANTDAIFYDVKGLYRGKIEGMTYISL